MASGCFPLVHHKFLASFSHNDKPGCVLVFMITQVTMIFTFEDSGLYSNLHPVFPDTAVKTKSFVLLFSCKEDRYDKQILQKAPV